MSSQETTIPTMTITPSKFRLRPWPAVLLNLITPLNLLAAAFGGYIVYVGITMLGGGFGGGETSAPGNILLILIPLLGIIPLGLLFAVGQIYLVALKVGTVAFSYVMILPDGLEVNLWPQFHVLCAWDRIERETMFPFRDPTKQMLRLPGAQTLPDCHLVAGLRPPRRFMPFLATSVMRFAPHMFRGYPGGKLEAALRQNAPHLFTDIQGKPGAAGG